MYFLCTVYHCSLKKIANPQFPPSNQSHNPQIQKAFRTQKVNLQNSNLITQNDCPIFDDWFVLGCSFFLHFIKNSCLRRFIITNKKCDGGTKKAYDFCFGHGRGTYVR